jgi:hypothetical protein
MVIMKNMIIKKSLLLTALLAGFLVAVPLLSVDQTYAQGRNEVCVGLGGCADAEAGVQGIVDTALNILSIIIGIAGVIMVMLGGFRYITSGGDASKTASAQNTILWALVGLAVAALAQIIVRFVLARI